MLHIHVLFVAPLGARHVAKSRTDQHQSRVPAWECPHHASPAADLTVQPFDHIVGADACPMLTWEVAVGQRFFNTVLHFLSFYYVNTFKSALATFFASPTSP